MFPLINEKLIDIVWTLFRENEQVHLDNGQISIDNEAVETLIALSDGDARCALNGLEFVIKAKLAADNSSSNSRVISDSDVRSGLVRSHIVYDRIGTCPHIV